MIGVDVSDATAAALSFVRRAGVTYPVGVDRWAAIANAWGVVAIPQTFFLDAGHRVIRRVLGAVTPAELTRDTAKAGPDIWCALADPPRQFGPC